MLSFPILISTQFSFSFLKKKKRGGGWLPACAFVIKDLILATNNINNARYAQVRQSPYNIFSPHMHSFNAQSQFHD